jgi:hypothetical protein
MEMGQFNMDLRNTGSEFVIKNDALMGPFLDGESSARAFGFGRQFSSFFCILNFS